MEAGESSAVRAICVVTASPYARNLGIVFTPYGRARLRWVYFMTMRRSIVTIGFALTLAVAACSSSAENESQQRPSAALRRTALKLAHAMDSGDEKTASAIVSTQCLTSDQGSAIVAALSQLGEPTIESESVRVRTRNVGEHSGEARVVLVYEGPGMSGEYDSGWIKFAKSDGRWLLSC